MGDTGYPTMSSVGNFSPISLDRALQAHVDRRNSRLSEHDRIDEGFSEAVNDESALDTPCAVEPIEVDEPDDTIAQIASVRNWLLTQPVELRSELARVLLASLPTPALSSIIKEADARLHFDPATYFPPEIYVHILKYLQPKQLIRASYVSKSWRNRAMDVTLWRRLFALEGWTSNQRMIRMLESTAQTQVRKFWTSTGVDMQDHFTLPSPSRHYSRAFRSRLWIREGMLQIPASLSGATADLYSHQGSRRRNLDYLRNSESVEDVTMFEANTSPSRIPYSSKLDGVFCPLLDPPRLVEMAQQLPRLNWHYIFTQRQRLEQNWTSGLYKNFRLPCEEHDHEKHRECIYTLQFSTRHVVSGSRDRTIRVWDLEAQRLKIPPLYGHKASVLCLQFDDNPATDIIVSGGSDAAVIFWKFSTGAQLKQIKKAHTMAVLNLRFDRRYLVTCSKDDTIKVWNMKDLTTSDPDYPPTNKGRDAVYPDYIVDVSQLASSPGLQSPISLPRFSLLMTLVGHSAAVNALQLLGDEIVSASGDRKIMLWHIPSGTLKRTFAGHAKGIACVQYDGRRIISGSSDESVRIFDVETAAEIALLSGHRDLVRTIQADFSDVPGDELREEAEARNHSNMILDNKRRRLFGELAPSPKDEQFIIGAKLPPGGGGNRWSKIVSGSYDETVIIWRQDRKGRWVIMKELRQEDAMRATSSARAAGGLPRVPIIPPAVAPRPSTTAPVNQSLQQGQVAGPVSQSAYTQPPPPTAAQLRDAQRQAALTTAQGWLGMRRLSNGQWAQPRIPGDILGSSSFTENQANGASSSATDVAEHGSTSSASAVRPLLSGHRQQSDSLTPGVSVDAATSFLMPPTPSSPPMQRYVAPLQPSPIPSSSSAAATAGSSHTPAHQQPSHPYFNPPQAQQSQQQQGHHHHGHGHHNQQQAAAPAPQQQAQLPPPEINTSRLFKLQFDSRRIICCSQQPIIVGWDFANGDKDIIEASQFFGETS